MNRLRDPARLEAEQCTCSRHNAHLLDLTHWQPDPHCPRHGLDAPRTDTRGQPLDIDTSYREEHQ